jgi:hypothetical protein
MFTVKKGEKVLLEKTRGLISNKMCLSGYSDLFPYEDLSLKITARVYNCYY